MVVDLVQLRTFVAVAEELHLTRAAERLHISQSAASAHIRAIEERLDTQLFLRTNRNLELTRAGQLLLSKANALLNEAALFTSFAREIRGKVDGTVTLGIGSEPVASRLGNIIAALRAKHPLIGVDLRALHSSATLHGLKAGELDVGLLLSRPLEPGFVYYTLMPVKFRIAGPCAWKAQIESAGWPELARLPWITPTDSSLAYAARLYQLFADNGLEPNTVVSFDNASIGRALLPNGVGMMLIREEHARQGERDGYLALSPLGEVEFSLFIAHLESRGNDPLIRAVMEAAADAWPELKKVAGMQ